jgi:hypothetical protein
VPSDHLTDSVRKQFPTGVGCPRGLDENDRRGTEQLLASMSRKHAVLVRHPLDARVVVAY